MRLQWSVNQDTASARWQGLPVLAFREGRIWRVVIDGKQCRGEHPTQRAAMEAVHAALDRVIAARIGTVAAQQRALGRRALA